MAGQIAPSIPVSTPTNAAACWTRAASAPGIVFSCSTPSTSTQSYRPASISAIAASVAIEPEAQAASWRIDGVPHSSGTTVAGIAPRCP